jgi:hypothetical protein
MAVKPKRHRVKKAATKRTSVKKVAPKRSLVKKVAPKRRTNPIIELFHIKILKGGKIYYFDGAKGTPNKNDAALYHGQAQAKRIASDIADAVDDSVKVYVEGTVLKK